MKSGIGRKGVSNTMKKTEIIYVLRRSSFTLDLGIESIPLVKVKFSHGNSAKELLSLICQGVSFIL